MKLRLNLSMLFFILFCLFNLISCGRGQLTRNVPDTLNLDEFFDLLHKPKLVRAMGFQIIKPQNSLSNWLISRYDLKNYLFLTYKLNKSETHTTFFRVINNEAETLITNCGSFYSMISNEILSIRDTNTFKWIDLKVQVTNRQNLWAVNFQNKIIQTRNGIDYIIINYGFVCYQPSFSNSYVYAVYSDRNMKNELSTVSSEEANLFLNSVLITDNSNNIIE